MQKHFHGQVLIIWVSPVQVCFHGNITLGTQCMWAEMGEVYGVYSSAVSACYVYRLFLLNVYLTRLKLPFRIP